MDTPLMPPVGLQQSSNMAESAIRRLSLSKNEKEAREAADSFEAMFLSQMLSPIFETIPTDGLMGGGFSEGIYRSMQVEEYGKTMMKAGGIGIAESIMREILLAQEA